MRTPPSKAAPTPTSNEGGRSNQDNDTALLIGSPEAARRLGIGTRTLWALTKCNAIPSHRIGRSVRYALAEIEAWVTAGCPTDPGSAARVRKGVAR